VSTTAIAVSTMAAVQAAAANVAAQQAANAARHAECTTLMQGYAHAGATEPTMRAYAQCVEWLYPVATAATLGERTAVALLIVSTIVGAMVGARMGRREDFLGRVIMFPTFGAIVGACVAGLMILLWLAVVFVFGG